MSRTEFTGRPTAGGVLAVLSALPAILVAGWLLAGLPLLALGCFRPLPAVALALVVTAALGAAGLRRLAGTIEASAAQVAGVLAVAVGSGAFNAIFHSEQFIVRRDPATYAQYAVWIAKHGFLPIGRQEAAFGGADPALLFGSMGFYDRPEGVVPQFMPGPPLLYAAGEWVGGLLLSPAVLGALAVLVVAGVAARLTGGRWAVPAALAFAISLPVLYTSRTTFSEIPSLILLFGAVTLLHDARAAGSGSALKAGLAGLVAGLAVLVRVDGLRDVLPVLAYAGFLIAVSRIGAARRAAEPGSATRGAAEPGGGGSFERRAGWALLGGVTLGAVVGLLAAVLLAKPYLAYLSRSVIPLLAICAVVLVLTAVGAALAPRLAWLRRPRFLPEAAAVLAVLVMAGLAVRPWVWQAVRRPSTPEDWMTFHFIEAAQRANGLPADGTRLYFENSLTWVVWYIGLPAVVLATLAAAVLLRRTTREGRSTEWLLPLALIGWTTVTSLLRPEITPDHPWAARRLVPVVLPGLILLAVWGLAWLGRRVRSRYGRRPHAWLAGAGVALLLVPGAVTSAGIAFTPVGRGERAALDGLRAALPPRASVLIVERVTGDRFTEAVRGMFGVPTARVRRPEGADTAPEAEVRRLVARVRAAGRTPVLLAAEAGQLTAYGTPRQVLDLTTKQDARSLVKPPSGVWNLKMSVWMTIPPAP